MAEKLKAFLRVVGHTILSFIAASVAGFTFYAFFRPIVGRERYSQIARGPVLIVLVLIVVALWGTVLYERWRDHRAFFAWVLPALWACHIMLTKGVAALPGGWADISFFLGSGVAYSVGAIVGAVVLRAMPQNHGTSNDEN